MIHRCIIHASGTPENAWMHSAYKLSDARTVIRDLRVKRGFTSDRALAIAAGIPQPTLSRYLAGTTESMDIANFQALADALDVSMSELLAEIPIGSGGRVKELARLMEQLPQPEKDALLAAAHAMVEATKAK